MVAQAVDTFGALDTLVCNAGIVRDRMLVNMSVEEWDAVIRVHLRGVFCPVRHAIGYWREEQKAGTTREARIVTTSSGAGLRGSIAQSNYVAAKAGIAALTINAAAELGRYGVRANTIAPSARSRMTEQGMPEMMKKPETGFDVMDPANVSPFVVWLGSVRDGGWRRVRDERLEPGPVGRRGTPPRARRGGRGAAATGGRRAHARGRPRNLTGRQISPGSASVGLW
jgi:NAD(P)-dependent dehydrogenase (short-subunit alcohol dehydrogenase family)